MKLKNLSWMAFLTVIFFLSACTKEENIGQDIVELPGDQLNVVYVDTLTINAHSYIDDSLRTDETSLSTLGSYKDAIFGTTTSGFYTHLRIAANNLTFGNLPVCDSIILSLKYNSLFGDTNFYNVIRVYELTQSIYKDSSYYSNMQELTYDPTPLATLNTQFKIKDSVLIDGVKQAPQLRIKLDESFANKIMAKSGGTELSTNEEFLKFIKGLYVTASKTTSGGSIASFDLVSTVSQMTIFYHNSTDTALKTNFIINANCARINVNNHYGYIDAGSEFKNQVINSPADTSLGNQLLYIQSLGGVGIKLNIPYLMNLQSNNKKIAIQKAELILNVNPGSISNIQPNPSLALVKVDASGNNQLIDDYPNYDGAYSESNTQYKFIITSYLQRILKGDNPNYGLKLLATGSAIRANRVVLNGAKAPLNPMKIKIMYTIVN